VRLIQYTLIAYRASYRFNAKIGINGIHLYLPRNQLFWHGFILTSWSNVIKILSWSIVQIIFGHWAHTHTCPLSSWVTKTLLFHVQIRLTLHSNSSQATQNSHSSKDSSGLTFISSEDQSILLSCFQSSDASASRSNSRVCAKSGFIYNTLRPTSHF